MECTYDRRGDAVVVEVDGRVDESTWQAFGDHLSEAINRADLWNCPRLVIDLAKLAYMSSRGLRVLTIAKREAEQAGVVIELAAPNEVMREILAISRYDKLFDVTDAVRVKS